MLHKITLAVLLTFLFVSPEIHATERDGNKLLTDCSIAINVMEDVSKEPTQITSTAYCLGHVRGADDMHNLYRAVSKSKPLYCMPSGVTMGQMVRIIVKYLKENPEQLHEDGTMLIAAALRDAYPCKT